MRSCLFAPTLPGADLWCRVTAAAAAGFDAVSLSPVEAAEVVAAGRVGELRRLLDRQEVELGCLDPVVGWVPEVVAAHPAHAPYAAFSVTDCLRLADRLGVRLVNAIDVGWVALPAGARDGLRRLVDAAADAGIEVAVEFQVYSGVPDLDTAASLAEASGAGLTLDAWHLNRSRRDLVVGRSLGVDHWPEVPIHAVQLSDGPADPAPDPVLESTTARRLPGAGDFDLAAVLGALPSNADPLVGVEVFDARSIGRPAPELAHAAMAALRGLLDPDVRAGRDGPARGCRRRRSNHADTVR